MLRELIIRILQTIERKIFSNATLSNESESRLTAVIRFIRDNVHKSLHAEELSKIACMSVSNFYRTFKSELGISPV
jgi:transcriptional regulator GlxA family with amidase domain